MQTPHSSSHKHPTRSRPLRRHGAPRDPANDADAADDAGQRQRRERVGLRFGLRLRRGRDHREGGGGRAARREGAREGAHGPCRAQGGEEASEGGAGEGRRERAQPPAEDDDAAHAELEWYTKWFLGVHFAANWVSLPEGFLDGK